MLRTIVMITMRCRGTCRHPCLSPSSISVDTGRENERAFTRGLLRSSPRAREHVHLDDPRRLKGAPPGAALRLASLRCSLNLRDRSPCVGFNHALRQHKGDCALQVDYSLGC